MRKLGRVSMALKILDGVFLEDDWAEVQGRARAGSAEQHPEDLQ